MKALLIKDLKLMKGNILFILSAFLVLALIYIFFPSDKSVESSFGINFIIFYMTFLGLLVGVKTINLDEENNSNLYLFTLPISRKTYVLEKYLFSFFCGFFCWFISICLILVVDLIRDNNIALDYVLVIAFTALPILLLTIDLMIPIELKFGASRSRLVLMVLILGMILAGYLLSNLGVLLGINIIPLIDVSFFIILPVFYLITFVLTVISYLVSKRIVKNKEF